MKDIIVKLKRVRNAKGLTYQKIIDMVKSNGDDISKATLSRIFAEGSESRQFNYRNSILPVERALLCDKKMFDGIESSKELKRQLFDKTIRIYELESLVDELKSKNEKLKNDIEFQEQEIKEDRKWIDYLEKSLRKEEDYTDKVLQLYYNCLDMRIESCGISQKTI